MIFSKKICRLDFECKLTVCLEIYWSILFIIGLCLVLPRKNLSLSGRSAKFLENMPIFYLNKVVTSNSLGSGLNGIFVFRIWLNATVAELLEVGITFSVLSLEDHRPLLFPSSKTTNLPIHYLPTISSSPLCILCLSVD